jgi:hypothetical protein
MGRKKNISLKLNPEWMFTSDPLDFEYNKYTILGYLQKCDKGFDKMELYPDFVELSLHLANIQSLNKENLLLLTNKKFESCDDELLIKDLYSKKPRELDPNEKDELLKTLRFSGTKLYDAFNKAKSIWNLSYDSIELHLKKNKEGLFNGIGYVYFNDVENDKCYVWQYEIKTPNGSTSISKTYFRKIYDKSAGDKKLIDIIIENNKFKGVDLHKRLPIFEVKTNMKLPMEKTFIPIVKRKIMAYIYQVISYQEKVKNLD